MNKKKLFNLDELHIPIILLDILKNIWLAVMAVLIACVGVFAYANMAYQPVYTTEVTFVVSPRSNGSYVGFYSSLSTTTEMAGVFGEVFSSDVLQRLIKEDLQNPELSFAVKASVAEDTNILQVTAEADSPEAAHLVIQSVLRNYRRVSGYLFGSVVLDVLKKPQISVTPSNPFNLKYYMTLGAIFAAILMVALIALISALRPTIKTLACAKRRMEDTPLGILPKENRFFLFRKRMKKPPLITDTSTSFRYTESFLQFAHRVRHKMGKKDMKVLLVTSVAENEGKSTISANLALALAKHGHKVAYVDMDLRKPAVHKVFKQFPREDLRTCLQQGAPASLDDSKLLHILSNSHPDHGTDQLLHSEELVKLLDVLREKMDYVILDSAPYTATADTGMLLKHTDCCVMVVRQDWVPYQVCQDVSEDLNESRAEYLGYVINHYRDNGTVQGFREHYGKYGYYRKTT
ncbi:MAG: P-loop NTPase [Oscillospiraceae bacterium]|nr:P-loop NTPase [Oscillospiraceae bacterium]